MRSRSTFALGIVLFAGLIACGSDERDARFPGLQAGPLRPATAPPEHKLPSPPATTPEGLEKQDEGTRLVAMTASDDKRLTGRLFGDEGGRTRGVVLLHASDKSRQSWTPFAKRLMSDGLAVFALDFRGYGQSDGPKDPEDYPRDVAAALETMRIFGISDIVIVGAEVGGTAAAGLSEKTLDGVNGLAVIGSDATFQKLDVTDEAKKLDIRALVISDRGKESDLADLIPDATSETIAIGDDAAGNAQVTSRIERFIDDVL